MPTGSSRLDAFESMFRSALHEVFHFERPRIQQVVLVTDLAPAPSEALLKAAREAIATIDDASDMRWSILDRTGWIEGQAKPIPTLIERLEQLKPDLVVTTRHLLGAVRDLPWTLGSVVDTITQTSEVPVLLLSSDDPRAVRTDGTQRVLAVTDRLQGDDHLVNWAVHFTHATGTLFLAHLMDTLIADRALEAIERLPGLDSSYAKAHLKPKLLDIPMSYLQTVERELKGHQVNEAIVPLVSFASGLQDYLNLLDEHDIHLLIVDSKDEGQRAMSSKAHALAVEVRDRPVLLL